MLYIFAMCLSHALWVCVSTVEALYFNITFAEVLFCTSCFRGLSVAINQRCVFSKLNLVGGFKLCTRVENYFLKKHVLVYGVLKF